MGVDYLAVLDDTPAATRLKHEDARGLLHQQGLEASQRIGRITLYLKRSTQTLSLPFGACLVGELYASDGHRVMDAKGFMHCTGQRQLREHIIDRYWGEYILFHSDADASTTVLRDPSGALGCAYSDEAGFVTSNIALASQLGLVRNAVDWDFIRHFLIHSHTKIARTGISGISELLPGCALKITGRSSHTTVAWSPWRFAQEQPLCDMSSATHLVRRAVSTVVSAMAATDQSLLLQLSGGLDSSIVGVCLQDTDAQIHACTAISPLPGGDESPYAEQVSMRLGVALLRAELDVSEPAVRFKVPAQSLRPAVSPLARAASCAMNPFVEGAQVNAIYSGGGGDTVFCYLKTAAPAADAFRHSGWSAGCRSVLDLTTLHRCTVAHATRLTLRKLMRRHCLDPQPCAAVLKGPSTAPIAHHPWAAGHEDALPGTHERIVDLAGTQIFREIMLREDERRVRLPLLSQPVMEACLRIPSWLWIEEGINRAVARTAFSDILPPQIIRRRSKGNLTNFNAALYQRHKTTMGRFLLDGCLNAQGILDPDQLKVYLGRHLEARDLSFLRILDLCMVENWTRQHG